MIIFLQSFALCLLFLGFLFKKNKNSFCLQQEYFLIKQDKRHFIRGWKHQN